MLPPPLARCRRIVHALVSRESKTTNNTQESVRAARHNPAGSDPCFDCSAWSSMGKQIIMGLCARVCVCVCMCMLVCGCGCG